jgi:opacity protein-like surface antigen
MRQGLSMLATAVVIAVASVSVYAADVTGKWTAQVPGRDGQTREQTFTFKVAGETLTGTVSGMAGDAEIKDGTVKGDDIAFSVVRSFQGQEMKFLYKGKVSGNEIKFTSTRDGGDAPPREFTAKRVTS